MKKKSTIGYTILEVLVAVIILAIALPGLTMLVVGSRTTQVNSLRFENAAAFGQKVFDDLSLLPPEKVPTSLTRTTTIDGQTYTATLNKTALLLGGNKAQITISWKVGKTDHSSVLNGVLP